jgi:hypothetical protein
LEHKPKIDIYNEPNSFWDINIKTKCNILKCSFPRNVNDQTNITGNPDSEVNFNNNNNTEEDILEINLSHTGPFISISYPRDPSPSQMIILA